MEMGTMNGEVLFWTRTLCRCMLNQCERKESNPLGRGLSGEVVFMYNAERFYLFDGFAIAMLGLGLCGAITTSRWFVSRLLGLSVESLYRLSAFWPVIMLVAL